MKNKRYAIIIPFFLLIIAVLAACGGGEAETVEVTRVVTETVEIEGETVEVTVVISETEIIEAEPAEEATEEEAAEEVGDDLSATGSEDLTGDGPPPPDTGPKVASTRTSTEGADGSSEEVAAAEPEAELRSTDADAESSSAAETIEIADSTDESVDASLPLDQNRRLTAGEVDDNANWDDYLLYLRNYSGASIIELDISERHQILVTDSQGNPVLGARIGIEANGEEVMVLRTHSNGRSLFFPRMLPFSNQADSYTLNISVNGITESTTVQAGSSQREWTISHSGADQQQTTTQLDIMFLIDATGSMADEINQLKENIRAVAAQIDALPAQPNVRFGMVTYRDIEDDYLYSVTDFTPDVEQFATALANVEAAGGGDYPEDLNEALFRAIHQPEWRVENSVSLIFLVADAPPHLDYGQQNHYGVEVLEAVERGIKIFPIASSGLDSQGEYVFRQLAQISEGRFIFLTYGAEGAGSTGTETELNVSDYTVSSLDGLVVQIVEEELAFLLR